MMHSRLFVLSLAMGVAAVGFFACVGDDPGSSGASGNEGQACFENNTCNGDLTCVSRVCVRLDGSAVDGSATNDATSNEDAPGNGDASSDTSTPLDASGVPCANTAGLKTSRVAYWPLDGDLMDPQAGLELTSQSTTFVSSKVGLGLALNGAQTTKRSVVEPATFSLNADFTLHVWASFDDLTGCRDLISTFNDTGGPGWTFLRTGDDKLQIASGAGVVETDALSLGASTMYQLAARRSNGVISFFVNGAAKKTVGLAGALQANQALHIGSRAPSICRLKGVIDEAAIWTRALSDAEIVTLYNSGQGCSMK